MLLAGEIENGDPDGGTIPAAKVTVAVLDAGTDPRPHTMYWNEMYPRNVLPGLLHGGVKLMPVEGVDVTAAVPEVGDVETTRLGT